MLVKTALSLALATKSLRKNDDVISVVPTPLTVNVVPMFEMGNKAAHLIINKIKNKKHHQEKPNKISFERKLIIRKSTKLLT